MLSDWPGLGDDLPTREQKEAVRKDMDLPEEIDRALMGNHPELGRMVRREWRTGGCDIAVRFGQLLVRKTP